MEHSRQRGKKREKISFLDVFCSVEQFLDSQRENVENKDGRAICEPIWGIYRIDLM